MSEPTNPYADQGQFPQGQFPSQPAKKSNTVLIVLVVCLAVMVPVMCVCAGLLLPAVQSAREAARRMQCSNNIKLIGLAMHNYHSAYRQLPPAYTVDANGRPLHSWRTALLPFLEQQALFEQIDMDKPWDDPVNLAISQVVVPAYSCPSTSNVDPTMTTYLAVVDASGVMTGSTPTSFGQVTDGLSNTILVYEADADLAVPWMKPQDTDMNHFLNPGMDRGRHAHPGGGHVLMSDGAVQFVTDNADPKVREAMVTKDGDEGMMPIE
jgi:hypothetical protein